MDKKELLDLQDTIGNSLRGLSGVRQAMQNVRDDSTEYAMCQMLAGAVARNVDAIAGAVPKEWRSEMSFW